MKKPDTWKEWIKKQWVIYNRYYQYGKQVVREYYHTQIYESLYKL